MTDQNQPNPRFELTCSTLVECGTALVRYGMAPAPQSRYTVPTGDVVHLLRRHGLPVSVRGTAPRDTVVPRDVIRSAVEQLAAEDRDMPAAELLELLAGFGIPVHVDQAPIAYVVVADDNGGPVVPCGERVDPR